MSRILISTSRRSAPPGTPSGHLYVYDLAEGRILRKSEIIEPPYRDADPNPRGGFRGLKGVSIQGRLTAIANASTIFIYDRSWQPIAQFWHPSCAGIHDIELDEENERVWASSSRNDLLICLDFNGDIQSYTDLRVFSTIRELAARKIQPFLSEQEILRGAVNFRDPHTHDLAVTDTLHVNSFAFVEDGSLLISCGLFRRVSREYLHRINNFLKMHPPLNAVRRLILSLKKTFFSKQGPFEDKPISSERTISLLLRITPSGAGKQSLILEDCKFPSHSIRLLSDKTALYLNTTTGEIVHFNPVTDAIHSTTRIGRKFLRGACELPDGCIVIGDNNEFIHFDLANRRILSRTRISDDVQESVFDIHILPDKFALPPESFRDLYDQEPKQIN